MTELLPRTDLDQLCRQAKELLHAAQGGTQPQWPA